MGIFYHSKTFSPDGPNFSQKIKDLGLFRSQPECLEQDLTWNRTDKLKKISNRHFLFKKFSKFPIFFTESTVVYIIYDIDYMICYI